MSAAAPPLPGAATRFCDHCGLPVGSKGHVRELEGAERRFCCAGCGIAWRFAGAGGREGGSEASAFLARIGLGFVLSMIIMLIAWVPYLDPKSADSDGYRAFAPVATLIAATPVFLLLGVPYLWNAVTALRRGSIGADLLIGLGITAAYAASVVGLASGRPDALYLDTAAGLATLVTVGRWLEATAKERAARQLRSYLSDAERPAARLAEGATLAAPGDPTPLRASDLVVGDRVLVRPGHQVPSDGVVAEGRALVDEAALTGEPLPRAVAPGDAVAAPVIPTDGALVVRITAVAGATRLGAVSAVLARARAERSPLERLADRLSAIFVPTVIVLAGLVLARDLADGDGAASASLRALSVLVIACPCALAIATPLAVTAALGRLAERGILVRTGAALAGLPRIRAVAFDKTGTLTVGRPVVSRVDPRPGVDADLLLALAASVEQGSEHALARGIVLAARAKGLVLPTARDVRVTAGLGVEGTVDDAGSLAAVAGPHRVRVGRPGWAGAQDGPTIDGGKGGGVGEGGDLAAGGSRASAVDVALDGRLLGRLHLDDRVRDSSAAAVAALLRAGVDVSILSGDTPSAVLAVAQTLGLPAAAAHGGCLPDGKVEALRALRAATQGPVAFVGDGLNDAPALAAADLGIAVGSGTDLARETADVSLLGDDLGRLPGLFRAARRTRNAVRWNLFWAFVYNVVGVAIAVVSHLPPVFAALAMVVSSLFVIGNSARLRTVLGDDLAAPPPLRGGSRPG